MTEEELIERRAPFSSNPRVGVRGREASERILTAALDVFGDVGYEQCGVVRIAEVAGCSPASFYQYFSNKEDVFRRLSGRVGRALIEAVQEMPPVTGDAAGRSAVHGWITRHAAVHTAYEPVFRAFQTAVERDDQVATGSDEVARSHRAALRNRLSSPSLPAESVDGVLALLMATLDRFLHIASLLDAGAPELAPDRWRRIDSLTDVVHRTLFGRDDAVNVSAATPQSLSRPGPAPDLAGSTTWDRDAPDAGTAAVLLEAAQHVLVSRGFRATRIDDVTDAAGLSHGAFYRYFANKEHLVRVLADRALHRIAPVFSELPNVGELVDRDTGSAVRNWIDRYVSTYSTEAAIIQVWIDATAADAEMNDASLSTLDAGWRALAAFLAPRQFGDVTADALVMLALLDALRVRSPTVVDAAAFVVERGLLGADS